MNVYSINDFKNGWFIGDFEPSVLRTSQFEVAFHSYKSGQEWEPHYHKDAIEISYLAHGTMEINGIVLLSGDVIVIYPMEISRPKYLSDCEVIIIKAPSLPRDKYVVE